MVQIGIDLIAVLLMPLVNRFAGVLEGCQMGFGIPITPFMIGNHGKPGFEEAG